MQITSESIRIPLPVLGNSLVKDYLKLVVTEKGLAPFFE